MLQSPGSQLRHCSCRPVSPAPVVDCSDGHDSLSPLPSCRPQNCRLMTSPAHHAPVLQSVLRALCSAVTIFCSAAVCKKWEHKPITAELTTAGNTQHAHNTAADCSNAAIPTPSVSVCHCSTTHASNILTMGSPGNSLLMTATLAPHLDNCHEAVLTADMCGVDSIHCMQSMRVTLCRRAIGEPLQTLISHSSSQYQQPPTLWIYLLCR